MKLCGPAILVAFEGTRGTATVGVQPGIRPNVLGLLSRRHLTLVHPCTTWFEEVRDEEIVIDPDDIRAESWGNLQYLSLTRNEAAMVTVDDIEALAPRIVEARRAQLIALNAAPMVLYWWHDFQAGHLRFSMVSASHERLPFGCRVVPVDGIREIASDWLTSPWLHGIRLDTLEEVPADAVEAEPEEFTLAVWTLRLP
jgi:hypothetical protein